MGGVGGEVGGWLVGGWVGGWVGVGVGGWGCGWWLVVRGLRARGCGGGPDPRRYIQVGFEATCRWQNTALALTGLRFDWMRPIVSKSHYSILC